MKEIARRINLTVFFVFITLFVVAQNSDFPIIKVYVDYTLIPDSLVRIDLQKRNSYRLKISTSENKRGYSIVRFDNSYRLKISTPKNRLVAKIPIVLCEQPLHKGAQIDSLIILINSTAPKRKVNIMTGGKGHTAFTLCTLCHRGKGPYSSIVIWESFHSK